MVAQEAQVDPSHIRTLTMLPPAELDRLLAEKEAEYIEAAQQAAPLSWQLQLARELVAIRMARRLGEAGISEVGDFTDFVQHEMEKLGFFGQVLLDGLRGKVSDQVIDHIAAVVDRGLQAQDLIHHATSAAIAERIQEFKAPSTTVRARDVAYAVAFNKVPRKLGEGRR